MRAIATRIKEYFGKSVVGLDDKLAAGLIYADTIGNLPLAQELRTLGAREWPDPPTQTLARDLIQPGHGVPGRAQSSRAIPPAEIVLLPDGRFRAPF